MKYKNNGPVTLYVVIDSEWGSVQKTYTNKQAALQHVKEAARPLILLTYDQRGVNND